MIKKFLKWIGSFVLLAVLAVGGYIAYVMFNYSRIDDNVNIDIENPSANEIDNESFYTAITYNIGFGAYDPEYSFFMDEAILREPIEGVGEAGSKIIGVNSTASSADMVKQLTAGAFETVAQSDSPSIILFQEIDSEAHRSFGVNQVQGAKSAFPSYSSAFSSNFHTVWLQYPPLNPIGNINGGILSLSNFQIQNAVRRSLPVSDAFPTKFFDLDRCFQVNYLPVAGMDRQLVMINLHLSAYDANGEFKKQQLEILYAVMADEYAKGNYVIVGGDFNNALADSLTRFQNSEEIPDWIMEFDTSKIPAGFSQVVPENSQSICSVRDSSFKYLKGQNYETITDGWLVSDNVTATSKIIDTGYAYSDHNPVQLKFLLGN